jgi:tRNA G26 N,N-dimethylase Trm1
MEDINSVIDDNMKLYTADTIRKMMPYDSYTAEDFVRKMIMPKIVTAAINGNFYYKLNLNDVVWKEYNVRLEDVIRVLTNLGFYVSDNEYYIQGILTKNELHISWAKKKELDKNE